MKKSEIFMIGLGLVMMVAGTLLFTNLKSVNAVDSHAWTINLNGIKSFPWLTFSGFVLFTIGIIFNIASKSSLKQASR